MAQQNKSNSLTEGSVARGMLLFAIPIFISNLFQQLYNAADSLIVGNFLGGEALAAVGSSGSLIFLLTGFVNGVALGAGVLIARYFGAKDWESLEKAIHTTVALGLAAGAVLTVVGVILTPQILHWMGTPEDVIGNSVAYFRTYFLGSIAVVMYNVGASILQSVGNSRSPMKYLITASLINIVLDLLFIGVLGYGVAAAAFATIISQSVSAILAFSKLMRSKEAWAVSWRKVRFDGPMLHGVILQGLPSGIQNSVISLANVIVQANINSFGALAMAGCGSYSKVEGFAFRITGENGYDVTLETDENGEIFLEGLRIGEYKISEVNNSASAMYILPADKEAAVQTGSTTVVEMHNELRDTPKTGDDSKLGLWLALAGVSAAGIAACGIIGFKKKKKKEDN